MRVALYTRVSTAEQAVHGLSLRVQLETLESWARAQGHEVVGVFTDEGISARKPAAKRGALQRLLREVRFGRVDLIAFTKLDRWFRNVQEYYRVQEVLEAHGAAWQAIQEDYETRTASGRFKVNIMLAVAQDEADRTSERIRAVQAAKRERLEYHGGTLPLGYRAEGKKVVKDEKMEEAVSLFFSCFLREGNVSSAVQLFASHAGVLLQPKRAEKMLQNSTYCGTYYGVEGVVEAYISREEHEWIVETLKGQRAGKRAFSAHRAYLFSGMVFCAECGRRMTGMLGGSKAAPVRRYRCAYRWNSGKCGNSKGISERRLEAELLSRLDEAAKERYRTFSFAEKREFWEKEVGRVEV